jgi:hypothetical protein
VPVSRRCAIGSAARSSQNIERLLIVTAYNHCVPMLWQAAVIGAEFGPGSLDEQWRIGYGDFSEGVRRRRDVLQMRAVRPADRVPLMNGLSMYNDGRCSSKNPGWHENHAPWKARQVLQCLVIVISGLNRSWTSAAEPAVC